MTAYPEGATLTKEALGRGVASLLIRPYYDTDYEATLLAARGGTSLGKRPGPNPAVEQEKAIRAAANRLQRVAAVLAQ